MKEANGYREVYEALLSSDRLVHPGASRTSPLIWHIMGRNTSRPWDASSFVQEVTLPDVSSALSDREKTVFVEWIDMGAAWDHEEAPQEEPGAGERE